MAEGCEEAQGAGGLTRLWGKTITVAMAIVGLAFPLDTGLIMLERATFS